MPVPYLQASGHYNLNYTMACLNNLHKSQSYLKHSYLSYVVFKGMYYITNFYSPEITLQDIKNEIAEIKEYYDELYSLELLDFIEEKFSKIKV